MVLLNELKEIQILLDSIDGDSVPKRYGRAWSKALNKLGNLVAQGERYEAMKAMEKVNEVMGRD